MPSTYCSSCGHKMDYTLQKPKFCNECGQSLGTLKSTPETQKRIAKGADEDIANFDPDGSDVYEVPEITEGLQYDIEYDEDTSFTLGSILPSPEEQKPTKKRGRPRKKR
jgi:hypothetical protein